MEHKPELNREIATTADGVDITRGYVGPLLAPYDSVLRQRGGGDLRIYEEVFSDPEVKSTFGQRQLAVTSAEWEVTPGGDAPADKAAAEFIKLQLERIGWDNVTTKMLFGVFYGFAVAELVYAVEGRQIVIKKLAVRNRRRFRYGKEGDLRLLTMNQMFEGIKCEEPYFWHYATGADNDDEPYGMGLAHWLYWPVLFKRNGLKFWLIFLEKFGAPTAVGKYNSQTATDTEKSRLLQAVRAVQVDSGVIIPEGMVIELLEAARNGTSDYKTLQDQMDATIQKVVLGQTASTQGTPGRLGNDDLQGDVRGDIVKADADLICESFNRGPVQWLTKWNFPGAKFPKVSRITEEPEDLTESAERDGKVASLGFKPTLKYVKEKYGGDWEPANKAEPNGASEGAAGQQPGTAQFAEHTPAADPAARMAQQLDRKLAPHAGKWIDQIRGAVDRAQSLEEVREYILRRLPDLTLDQYAEVMGEALTAAELAGRYELLQDVQH